MTAIEKAIKLPAGAHRLNDYARYYAYGANDDVIAVYVLPKLLSEQEKLDCDVMEKDLRGSHRSPCLSLFREKAPIIRAGDHYWMKEWTNLPFVMERHCGDIVVVYNKQLTHFNEVRDRVPRGGVAGG